MEMFRNRLLLTIPVVSNLFYSSIYNSTANKLLRNYGKYVYCLTRPYAIIQYLFLQKYIMIIL